jgi:tetratricopeptide (TPR) repeat protein
MHVGEYSVLSLIGEGGMGKVYRAHDARLGRDIAIKMLPPSLLGDADARARFQREARAVASLNHPNIVTIHEVGDHEDHPFIAFELVDGETLRDRINRGPLTVAEALAIASPLAEGLRHAHDHGVIHRDLKPGNVMVRPDGQVKILDFGLGKFVDVPQFAEDVTTNVPSGATEAGAIVGTAGYTAPEHLVGRPVDARSDQFAFGAILYEMLTGRRAFARPTAIQTWSAIIEDEPEPLAALAPRAPHSVVAIVNRCLRKHPEERFGSTGELVEALRRARDAAQPRAALMRWPVAVWVFVLAILVIAGVLVVPRMFESRQGPIAGTATQQRLVVLPFTNIGGEREGQAFADGLAELLTTRLSGFERQRSGLLIVPATEVRRESIVSAQDARRAFGATVAVSGSVQRTPSRIRLTLNLSDAITRAQVSGEVIEGDTVDAQALQDAAVASLAKMLGVQADQPVTRVTSAPGAYDYYVQGRGYLQRFERPDSVDSAIELFTQAIARDANFALGHAALGEAVWRKYELTRDPALVSRARQHVKDAIARDSDSAPVRLSSGIVALGTGSYETAVTELKRAQALEPVNPDVYRELGRAYEAVKRYTDAEATYRKAIETRPTDWSGYNALGGFLARRQRFAEALQQFQQVVTLTPDNARAYSNIGGVDLYLKRYDEAEAAFRKSVSIRPTPEAFSNLGTLYFNRGRFTDAAEAFQQSVNINGNNYRMWGNLGSAYHSVPDRDRERTAYERAIELGKIELAVDSRNAEVLADLADFSQAIGRRGEARQFAVRALMAAPANDGVVFFKVAVAYEGMGDRRQALAVLARAVRAGYPIEQIEGARSLEELRTDPAYERTVKR